jgi:LmbE family N-acetylglucosaminyl deacetylase
MATWRGRGGRGQRPKGARCVASRLALLALVAGLGSGLAYDRSLASAPLSPSLLPQGVLAGVQRLLVIAPHPDDETLAAGGLIQAGVAAGSDVRVVVVSNGDGQWMAPEAVLGRLRPRPRDYVLTGEVRQAETLEALRRLGVAPQAVSFLGYPDGGLERLWRDDWDSGCPVPGRFTRAFASPYTLTFDAAARYCGRDLLRDLEAIIGSFRPDIVVVPHPEDAHPDHHATAAFARLAVALIHQAAPDYDPTVWGYLVHYGGYPQPRGWRQPRDMRVPVPLASPNAGWVRFELTAEQEQTKGSAVRAYASQLRLLGAFLPSFVRRDELFAPLPLLDVSAPWQPVATPARETTARLLVKGADLIQLEAVRAANHVWLTVATRGALVPGLHYAILVKAPNGRSLRLQFPGQAVRTGRARLTAAVDLDALGKPAVLAVQAEVRNGATLDRSGWYLIGLGLDGDHSA